MTVRLLLLHYTPPGVIGGVEHVMREHAELLRARGFEVEVVAGRDSPADIPLHVIPELDSASPESKLVERELDAGVVTSRFYRMREAIMRRLGPLASNADAIIAHNAFTLHFNQPLTAVLWQLAGECRPGTVIAWCHDLAWTNSLYVPLMRPGYPWDLLRTPAPGVRYITISGQRRAELRELWGREDVPVRVVPNGIDPATFFRLSAQARQLVDRYHLFDHEIVLLLPVRITRRKNVEAGIRAVRALKDRGHDVLFLISGPQAPHHPGRSDVYLKELRSLRCELGLESEVVFLAEDLGHNLDSATIGELYALADALLFLSSQEGFGLPILEAALARVPAVVSDIPVFGEVGNGDVWQFDPSAEADTIASVIVEALDGRPSRLYRRVLARYRWDAIVDTDLLPLLNTGVRRVSDSA